MIAGDMDRFSVRTVAFLKVGLLGPVVRTVSFLKIEGWFTMNSGFIAI